MAKTKDQTDLDTTATAPEAAPPTPPPLELAAPKAAAGGRIFEVVMPIEHNGEKVNVGARFPEAALQAGAVKIGGEVITPKMVSHWLRFPASLKVVEEPAPAPALTAADGGVPVIDDDTVSTV